MNKFPTFAFKRGGKIFLSRNPKIVEFFTPEEFYKNIEKWWRVDNQKELDLLRAKYEKKGGEK